MQSNFEMWTTFEKINFFARAIGVSFDLFQILGCRVPAYPLSPPSEKCTKQEGDSSGTRTAGKATPGGTSGRRRGGQPNRRRECKGIPA